MSHSEAVKNKAQQRDPECWVSYSGKPKAYKSAMDARRTAALNWAELWVAIANREDMHTRASRAARAVDALISIRKHGGNHEGALQELEQVLIELVEQQ